MTGARGVARAWAIACLALLAVVLASHVARAAPPPDLRVRADADVVGLGDVVHVTLQATSSGGQPIDPQIGSSAGFAVVGISPSTSTQMTISNGAMSTQRVLTTVWSLRANKVGHAVIGPLTVNVDGTRYKTSTLRVHVVPAGQAPPRPLQQQQGSPFGFDPFANFFNNPFGQLPQLEPQQPAQPEQIPLDPKLALDAARGSSAFLHAVVDKTSAVIGEQVTYTCYIYVDLGNARTPELGELHEAPTNEFVRHGLQADDAQPLDAGFASVGGHIYKVEVLRRVALFPIATGDLATGVMKLNVGSHGGEVRESEDLRVHVTEPPVDGRPPGYAIGDVGQLSLSAEVVGREVEREGAIGVNVTISGTGNLPASITPPERAGVEWLDPQVGDKLGPQAGDRWGGARTFRYVVRLHRAGDVDLGDLILPYWDPQAKQYSIAHAPLGSVRVQPGAAAAAAADAPPDPLPGLPPLRASLAGRRIEARAHLDDSPLFWIALGAMPLAYAGAASAAGALKRAAERRAAKSVSPREELRARVATADAASANGEARAIDASTIRAIEAAAIAARGVNVRALATSDVARALVTAGAGADDAREVEELLRACEASRYSAAEASGEDARARWSRAKGAIDRLERAS